ncbi:MAG: CobW family GTP-binding protein [bacterium]|jgi:G3E family GTPase|nr:GTP-binding protein [Betaproteobacteria bacterium]
MTHDPFPNDQPTTRLPVVLLTGFLGAGKTTLLNRLLAHPALARSLVVINEIGEVGIDHLLVSTPRENMRLLENGCLCCEMRGDLVETLEGALALWRDRTAPPFDRVLVETTGLADPVPILQTLVADERLARHFRLSRTIVVVDAVHAVSQLETHPEAVKQVIVGDLLLLSKCDLAGDLHATGLHERLQALNPGAERLVVDRGRLPEGLLQRLGRDADPRPADIARWLDVEVARGTGLPMAGSLPRFVERPMRFRHAEQTRSFSFRLKVPATRTGLAVWLGLLARSKGEHLLRMKGIVNMEGSPVVVHSVQSIVHDPETLPAWPDEDHDTRLVFIGRGLDPAEIERSLDALGMPDVPAAPAVPAAFDAAAYEQFRKAAQGFR